MALPQLGQHRGPLLAVSIRPADIERMVIKPIYRDVRTQQAYSITPRPLSGGSARPSRQYPVRTNKMARVSIWNPFQIVLMFGLCLPEIVNRLNFGDDLAWP